MLLFFIQITVEAGDDGKYLDTIRKANIKGALVGVEGVTPEASRLSSKTSTTGGTAGTLSVWPLRSSPQPMLK
jgi:hypothetical protein